MLPLAVENSDKKRPLSSGGPKKNDMLEDNSNNNSEEDPDNKQFTFDFDNEQTIE